MSPVIFKIFLFILPILAIVMTFVTSNTPVVDNIEIVKNISSFASLMSAILAAVIGLVTASSAEKEVKSGRKSRLGKACYIILVLAITCFVVSTIALQYAEMRSFSIGLSSSLIIGTLIVLAGIMIDSE